MPPKSRMAVAQAAISRRDEPQVGYNERAEVVESRTATLRNIDLLETDLQSTLEMFKELVGAISPVLLPETPSGEDSVRDKGYASEVNLRVERLREHVQYLRGFIADVTSRVDL